MDIYGAYTDSNIISLLYIGLGVLVFGIIVALVRRHQTGASIGKAFEMAMFYAMLGAVGVYLYLAIKVEPERRAQAEIVQIALGKVVTQEKMFNGDVAMTYMTAMGPESLIIPGDIVQRAQDKIPALPNPIFNNMVLLIGAAYLFLALLFKKREH